MFLLLVIAIFYIMNLPVIRHYNSNRNERKELGKKHSRLWRARQDLLMHFDWALSRQDPIEKITNLGREIERMDRDMN